MIIVLKNDIYTQVSTDYTLKRMTQPRSNFISQNLLSTNRQSDFMTEINVQCTVLARAISFKGYKEFRQ